MTGRLGHRLMSHSVGLWLLAAATLIGLVAGGFFCVRLAGLAQQQRTASRLVEHSREVLDTASTLRGDIMTVTSEARGYVINRTPDTRARFEAATATVDADIAALRGLVAGNQVQQSALDRVNVLNAERVAFMRSINDELAEGDDRAASSRLRDYHGPVELDRLLGVVQQIKTEERRLLDLRGRDTQAATTRTTTALIASSVLVVVCWLLLFLMIIRQRALRLAGMGRLNVELEARVAERTAELAQSAARQRSYFENAPIGKAVLRVCDGADLVYEDMNTVYAAIYGCGREATIGRRLRDVWPEPIASAEAEKMMVCAIARQPMRYAMTHELGGISRCLELDVAPLLDQADDALRVLACVREVTEQRALERQNTLRAEQQAEAAEREMALFRNSADILFVVRVTQAGGDYAFTYESFSPSLEKQTGWKAEDLVGCSPLQTLPPAAAETVLANYRRCVAARNTISYSTRYETPFGSREFDGSLTPVPHPGSSEIVRLVGSLRDVTERNRLLEALHHSMKMEAIGRLAAGVAHDFNNVLQSIFSSLELVQEENLVASGDIGAKINEYAAIALHAAKRGAYLTNHLLCYARKQMLQPKTIVLIDLLSDIEKLLVRTLGPHITVKVRVDKAAPPVFADPSELETALLNLSINASHAMAQGGVLAIEAGGVVEADQHDTVRPDSIRHWATITVTDTGTGMDAATVAQATEPFFTTKGHDGTGLGLSMVQGFVAQSGGTLRITSKVGEGTSIELRLPATADSDGMALRGVIPGAVPAVEPKQAGSILLVDDDSDVLMTVGAFLQKDGFQVVRAAAGNQALAVLASDQRIDAMVTDFAMPGLNGVDLVTEARQIRPGLPAVVISGFLDIGTNLPPDGIMTLRKPFQRDALIRLVRQVIAKHAEEVSEQSCYSK